MFPKLKNRLRNLPIPMIVDLSPRPPFVALALGRYPYRGRRRMLEALGPELSAEVTWPASDGPGLDGDLASIFAETDNVTKWEHYLPIYETALATFRSRPIRMLEIGVWRGGSLQMWRRYLHPDSVIVGIDIDPDTAQFDDPSRGIHVRIGGQQDASFLQGVTREFGPFDVILDDGSHTTSHMVQTFQHLFANGLARGGLYVVEDIHTNYWKAYRDSPMSFVDFTKWLIDAMHAHYQVTNSELSFRLGDPHRVMELSVPLATTLIEKVEFYDSVAVIHRANPRRKPPSSIPLR